MLALKHMQLAAECNSPRKLLMWSRRSGKTSYIVQSAIRDMLLGKEVLIVTPFSDQSRLINQLIIDEFSSNILLQSYRPFIKTSTSFPYCLFKLEYPYGTTRSVALNNSSPLYRTAVDSIYIDNGELISRTVYTGAIFPILQSNEKTAIEILFTSRLIYRSDESEAAKDSGIRLLKVLWDEDPQWEHFHASYRELPGIDLAGYKDNLSWPEFRAHLLAEWVEVE